jgi:hypothetical protein
MIDGTSSDDSTLDRNVSERPFSMLDLLLDAEPLSQVVFIHNYIQLVFQGMSFNLYGAVTLYRSGCTLMRKDVGFCDELCRLIDQRVVSTTSEYGQYAAITFSGGTTVSVSVRPEDNVGPEAFYLGDNKGLMVVGEVEG